MRPLTPTQKAVGTNTYFIRAQIWFPDGSAVKAEIPWVDQSTGKRLTDELVAAMKKPEKKTNEEWEEEARKGLEERQQERAAVKAFNKLPIIKDCDWVQQPTSRPMRGIIDNAREITFSRELTAKELESAKKHLANDAYRRGKGWTGVSGYRTEERPAFVYRFTTTWDSSD